MARVEQGATRGVPAASVGPAAGLRVAAAALPVLAAVLVFLPALGNGFVWDDPTVLLQMRAMRGLGDLVVMPPIVPKFYYRPFIFATYLFDRALGGEAPFWFHASVIGWHALCTALVFVLVRRVWTEEWLFASAAALLFAVYPTHVESVAWMAGRSDVVVCAFVLLTVCLYAERERGWTAWAGSGAYFLGLLSKEMAVACLVLVPAWDLLAARRVFWRRYVPLAAATLAYFLLRQNSVGAYVGGLAPSVGAGELVLDVVRAMGFYVVRAVVPLGLTAYIPDVPDHPGFLVVGLAAPVLSLVAAARAWRRGVWPVSYLLLWFWATLAPSLVVILRRSASAPVADRYLYVPTVASCALVAWGVFHVVRRWGARPAWAVGVIVLLASGFAAEAVPYVAVWRSNLTFWSDVAAKVPHDPMPHREVGTALTQAGDLPGAEAAFERALAARSTPADRVMTFGNLGNLYRRQGRFDEAEQAFTAALALRPHPMLYHNLGMTLMARVEAAQRQGEPADATAAGLGRARDAFQRALAFAAAPEAATAFPEWAPAKTHALLGQVLYFLGDLAGARSEFEASLRLMPAGQIADVNRQFLQRIERGGR